MKPTSSRIQKHMIHKSEALEQAGTSREGTYLYLYTSNAYVVMVEESESETWMSRGVDNAG
jgi:hypothetical protein